MNWLEKLGGKKTPPDALASRPEQPSSPHAGGTVLRFAAKPAPTIAKAGPRFEPNTEIAGNLQIKTLLGSGGMGEVYLARQTQWDADIAVKVPNAEIVSDSETRRFIVGEAEAWTKLGLHPHIAYCYYAQQVNELLLLVIEYVDGGNLRTWIADGRCADLKTGLDLAIQFCHGLGHAHKQGLVHRDIKPENILLTQDGTLKITDFGIVHKARTGEEKPGPGAGAAVPAAAGITVAGVGTAEYMLPEQWSDQREIDFRVDIFAFGVCLYEILCGRLPYPAMATLGPRLEPPEPGMLRGGAGLPARLCELMKRCVDWDRVKRPSSTNEVLAELCHIYEEVLGEPSLHAVLPEISNFADDWNNRALSYLALGHQEDAERAWQTALQADPRHLESIYNYGLYQWRSGRVTDDALVRNVQEIVERTPAAWLPRYLLAQIHLERGYAEGAKEELGKIEGDGATRSEVVAAKQVSEELVPPIRLIRKFEGHIAAVPSACMSGDGRYAVSGSWDNTLKLWDVASGRCLRTFVGHAKGVNSVCLSADGRFVLSGSREGVLKLWDVESGGCLHRFVGHNHFVLSVTLSTDGRYALSGSWDRTLKMWDVASGRCLRTLEGHTDAVNSVCFTRDDRFAFSGSWDNTIKQWDVASGRCMRTFEGHLGSVYSVCVSVDGRHVLSGSSDKTLKLWNIENGHCLHTFEGGGGFVSLGAERWYALSEGPRLWDLASGRCLRTLEEQTHSVDTVFLSPDGRYALSGCQENTLKFWEIGLFRYRAKLRLSQAVRSAEAVSLATRYEGALADARTAIASGDFLGAKRFLQSAREEPHLRRSPPAVQEWVRLYVKFKRSDISDYWLLWNERHVDEASFVSLSADGRCALSSGSWDKKLKILDVGSGLCLRTLGPHSGRLNAVGMSQDGRYVLFGTSNNALILWDVESCLRIRAFEGHSEEDVDEDEVSDSILSVCLSPDGRFALSGSGDGILKLWDVSSGRCLRTLEEHFNGWHPTYICLSAGGDIAFSVDTSDYDNVILKLWDVPSGCCLRNFSGHGGSVESVFLSIDGQYALSGSSDMTLKLWDLASGRCLRTFEGHTSAVNSVCLGVDGRYAISGSDDKTLKLWEVASGRCLGTLEHATAVKSVSLSSDGQHVISGCSDGSVSLWFLDWELEENEPADWDEGARPYLDVFLRAHRPYGAALPQDRQPTDEEVTLALTRFGQPEWSEEDFQGLLYTIGCAGYGWLRTEGVRRELTQMTATWSDAE